MSLGFPFSASARLQGPHLRGFWTHDRITLAILVGLAPPLGVAIWQDGVGLLALLGLSLLTVIVWQAVFAARRRRPQRRDVIVTAVIFSIIGGSDMSLFPAALSLSFGIVLGELVFGGRGFGFLHPVVVALAFLLFAYPTQSLSNAPDWLAYACLPGAALLLAARLLSWRIIAGFFAGVLITGYVTQPGFNLWDITQGYLVFVAVFLAGDPASSACTNAGRWVNGLLTGALVWLFTSAGGTEFAIQGLIPAVLLGSIFAPLIDRLVIEAHITLRTLGHG